ncbi:MAG: glycosyltransferase family 4 protein [Ilumatobacter sp.]|uniref:glycosyltransferase family 4 protein n=1 Tax=Ilumatobacter sp. TaxID=1967498 RepID=UPI00261CD07E|nr:glycosyltransferase family 4 protein [Ilumatobacter sp.]MDJ0769701.1 glycosyltransferase family 4 protein [Ilumatobacter sp.]
MIVGVVATRLAGTDGVSLESAKLTAVLERRGHRVVHCAGALGPGLHGTVVPAMHFEDPVAADHVHRAFGTGENAPDPALAAEIEEHAGELSHHLRSFLDDFAVDMVIVQQALALPMHLSLGVALTRVITERGLPTLAHHHDFGWERERFATSTVPGVVDECFPPVLPNVTHAVINSIARRELAARQGVDSILLPNVFDFATPPPGIDDFNRDFRQAVGVAPDDLLVLQPTRVVPRKRIDLAIELAARIDAAGVKLVIPHDAGDEGMEYLAELRGLAERAGVDLLHIADRVAAARAVAPDGTKTFALWDVYPHADFVTYPSEIEGFGNALLETVYFEKPALVNRYPVYDADIGPLGFRFVECRGEITDAVVEAVEAALASPALVREMTEHNYGLGAEHFSLEALERILAAALPI